jgi:spectinomycin phosphotransferase
MEINLVRVLEIVKKEYGIETQNCVKLNIGFDINTFLFKVLSKDNKEYFLKIRINGFSELSLIVPLLISEIKPSHIINVIKTIPGKLYVHYSSLFIMVFPFINGQSGWNVSLTKNQFIEFGNVLHELHSMKLPHKYKNSIRKETFDNKYRERIIYYLNNIQCDYRDIRIYGIITK